jgi:hypothetical protein
MMDPQYRTTIGSGAFGRIEIVVYRKPGVPGTASSLSISRLSIEAMLLVKAAGPPADLY